MVTDKKTEIDYMVRLSNEMMQPVRRDTSKGNEVTETGRMMNVKDETAKNSDKVIAKWPDGFTCDMNENLGYIRGLQRGSGSSEQEEPLFQQMHSKTNNVVKFSQKSDRFLLLCVMEQAKQICQVRVDHFGEITDDFGDG